MGQRASRGEGEWRRNDVQRPKLANGGHDFSREQYNRKKKLEEERKQEWRILYLQAHFKEDTKKIEALIGDIETLPDDVKTHFMEVKRKYQKLKEDFKDVFAFTHSDQLPIRVASYLNPHRHPLLLDIERADRNANEDRLRDATNQIQEMSHRVQTEMLKVARDQLQQETTKSQVLAQRNGDLIREVEGLTQQNKSLTGEVEGLTREVKEQADTTVILENEKEVLTARNIYLEARNTYLEDMIQEGYQRYIHIRNLEVVKQRPEWEKWTATFPEAYREAATQLMNDVLVHIERHDINIRTNSMEVVKQRPEWEKWIAALPESYRAFETKNMFDVLIPREADYMYKLTENMKHEEKRQHWDLWKIGIPNEYSDLVEQVIAERVINPSVAHMYS